MYCRKLRSITKLKEINKYKVAQAGCGARGEIHLDSWLNNLDRFQVEALCDLDQQKARRVVGARKLAAKIYADADQMLAETKPDIFCFATLPIA